jgi:hypothetical protein
VSESFCVAFAGVAGAAVFDGTSWSARSLLGGGATGTISCASSTFCVSLDGNGRAVTYREGAWRVTPTEYPTGGIWSLSCPSASFCAGVGGTSTEAQALGFNGTSWSALALPPAFTADSVSCVAAIFCAATGRSGAATYDGSAWGAPVLIGGATIESTACASSSFCVAVGEHGDIETFNGSAWSNPRDADAERTMGSVSCPSESFCVAVDHSGYAVTLTEGATRVNLREISKKESLIDVSCASSSFCVAITAGGVLTFDGGEWSKPASIDGLPGGLLHSVSCPSQSFCVANTEGGDMMIGRPAPRIASLSPASGPATGGTTVTITGTDLSETTAVHFGANEATINAKTETSLTLEAPAGTGNVYVTVTTPGGTSPASGKEAKHAKFKYQKVKRTA